MTNSVFQITLVLFRHCNLDCDFCFWKNSGRGLSDPKSVLSVPEKVLEAYDRLNPQGIDKIEFSLFGGELFADDVPDAWFLAYSSVVAKLQRLFAGRAELSFTFFTNGVFKNDARVFKLISGIEHSWIEFSYDPAGRFTDEAQLELMKKNLAQARFLSVAKPCGMTLTGPNIDKVLKGEYDADILLDGGRFAHCDFYSPNAMHREMLPPASKLADFFIWSLSNRYWFENTALLMRGYLTGESWRSCSCSNELVWNGSEVVSDCLRKFNSLPGEMWESPLKAAGQGKYGCLECERYGYCLQPCWMHAAFGGTERECFLKKVYEWLDKNAELVQDDFRAWEKIHL